jgi:formiminotetrahydrofolate cyclodeaminase
MRQELAKVPLQTFLDELASGAATPGGGAAVALVGAMAAALVAMVCNLTIGRPRYAAVESAMRTILGECEDRRRQLTRLAEEDATAYASVAEAFRLPRGSEEERLARLGAVQSSLQQAAEPPLRVMEICRSLVPRCLQVAAHGNATVVSDAGVAAELAVAAVRASIVNVRINLAELKNAEFVAASEERIAAAEAGLADDRHRAAALVRARLAPKAKP